MPKFSIDTIKTWERFYRANFINCLTGFKSVQLIATINEQQQPNLAIFNNVVHLGADPALIGFVNRPLAAAPHTLSNIEKTGIYTINHIHPSFVEKAHQTSAKYDADINEFEAVVLQMQYEQGIAAPFVAESLVKYALKLVEIVPIKHNNTFFVIGAITNVIIEEASIINTDGFLNVDEINSVTSLGIDGYFSTNRLARYAYAKPNEPASLLK
jgi:flavin reductase (DIM6/NTAB) family NADH-FMN oxidoreductase RutF